MGTKPSTNFQSDRPESGGADRNGEREKSGLRERERQKYSADRAAERRDDSPAKHVGETPAADAEQGSRDGESAE